MYYSNMIPRTGVSKNKISSQDINAFTEALLVNTVIRNLYEDDLAEFRDLIALNDSSKSEEFILKKLPHIRSLVESRVKELFEK